MRLQPGTRFGPYRIVEHAGSGGMGQVYRAHDTRLARNVAIKVLPPEVAADPRRRARFEREARAISALSHPHICALHDIGRENDLDYLVLEFCEGQTLAARLDRGPLPLGQVLQYGIEIAGALSAAHRAGIVHRDLKPSNVMLTKSGVKLLDFGIARTRPAQEDHGGDTTPEAPMTEEGQAIGTLLYMAPEVLNGDDADARTDIFALGVVLYEMLTARRPFSGDGGRAGVIAAILDREPPPLRELRPDVPLPLEAVIDRCMSKRREDRWESAHDVAEVLRVISRVDVRSRDDSKRSDIIAAVAAALLVMLAVGLTIVWTGRARDDRQVVRLSIPLDAGVASGRDEPASVGDGWDAPPVAITADGRRIAYVAIGQSQKIYLRAIDSPDSRPVEAPEAGFPFFSPDGQWLGFFSSGVLEKVPVDGGTPRVITSTAVARGASWGSDGNIYFTVSAGGGLWRVSENGGAAQQLTRPDAAAGENSHRWPQLLPDGKHVLFTIRAARITSYDDASIAVLSLSTGKWNVVLEGGTYGQYAPTGHLLFGRGGTLYAAPFDLGTRSVTGPARKMIDGVAVNPSSGAMHYAFAATSGDLVYVSGPVPEKRSELVAYDRAGTPTLIARVGLRVADVKASPDGTKLALHSIEANDSIWVHDLRTGSSTRVSSEGSEHCCPVWNADGTRLLYSSFREDARLIARNADGTGEEEELARSEYLEPLSCSMDGELAVYETHGAGTQCDLWLVPLRDAHKSRLFLRTSFKETFARFSPDGNWIAYTSVEGGVPQIYVRPAVSGDRRWQISVQPAFAPTWSRDGTTLFFMDLQTMFAADIHTTEAQVRSDKPRVLFSFPIPVARYDVLGDRFVVSMPTDANRRAARSVNVVLNWKRELAAVRRE